MTDFCDDDWELNAGLIELLHCYRDIELLILDQNVVCLVEFYGEARTIRWWSINLDNTLVDVFLNIDWLSARFGVSLLEFVILDWFFTLHFALRRLVTDLELRNPYLLLASLVGILLSKRVYGILDIIVHC